MVVFGSLNMDLVVRVPRMPQAGETLSAHGFLSNPGGKGANQAVACARQGGKVVMVGRVGDDGFGAQLRTAVVAQGVNAAGVATTPGVSTGVAMIMVDDSAQNCIAVVPGANASVSVEDAEAMRDWLADAGLLLLQLEVPMASVLRAAGIAKEAGCTVLLNPAPAQALPEELWPLLDILVLNETEAQPLQRFAGGGREQRGRRRGAAAAARPARRDRHARRARRGLGFGGRHAALRGRARSRRSTRRPPATPSSARSARCWWRAVPWRRPWRTRSAPRRSASPAPGAQASMPSREEVERFA